MKGGRGAGALSAFACVKILRAAAAAARAKFATSKEGHRPEKHGNLNKLTF